MVHPDEPSDSGQPPTAYGPADHSTHAGSPADQAELEEPLEDPAVERAAKWKVRAIFGAAIVVIAMFIWAANRPQTASSDDLRDDAKRACQEDFIPKRLKAPATAEFTNVSVTEAGGTYSVRGSVDSQNTFGAQVRASFSCVMRQDGERWVLSSANVTG